MRSASEVDKTALPIQAAPAPPLAAGLPVAKVRRRADEFIVGVVLKAEARNELNRLLSAFSTLRKTGRAARLVILGGSSALEPAVTGAAYQFRRDILWPRDEQDTLAWLRECDILVSLHEGTPVCVLQAMLWGIPVITTALRVPHAVQHRRTAIRIPSDNETALSQAMLELAEHADSKLAMSVTAAALVRRQYSETDLSREYSTNPVVESKSQMRWLVKETLFRALPGSRLFRRGSRAGAQIALTIDDGPDPVFTPRILDILRLYGIRATFFLVGGCAEQYPSIVRRIAEEGHEVGNHSYSHPYFNRLSWRGAHREIAMTCSVLTRILGKRCRLFRPPFGKLSPRSLLPAWAARQQVVMWSVDLRDYCAQLGSVEARLAHTSLSSGDIILYHGVSEAALEALPRVIESALQNGRKAVTISELNRG